MLDAYLSDGAGSRVARRAFTAWADAAGLVVFERRGVLVASDGTGRVVSAMNTRGLQPSMRRHENHSAARQGWELP